MRTFFAGVVKLVDAPDSKSGSFGSVGSIPTLGTNLVYGDVQRSTKTRKPPGLAGFLLSEEVQPNIGTYH